MPTPAVPFRDPTLSAGCSGPAPMDRWSSCRTQPATSRFRRERARAGWSAMTMARSCCPTPRAMSSGVADRTAWVALSACSMGLKASERSTMPMQPAMSPARTSWAAWSAATPVRSVGLTRSAMSRVQPRSAGLSAGTSALRRPSIVHTGIRHPQGKPRASARTTAGSTPQAAPPRRCRI